MTEVIPLCVPSVGDEERLLLNQCISDNFVSSVGPFVTQFEDEFARYCGADYAVAMSSGTSALHIAMVVSNVGRGDLVAVADFTFIASANAAAYTGADLLLVDSEQQSWNMNTELLYDEVHRRAAAGLRIPKAIEVVHILGHPADIEPLLQLRTDFEISLIEDAAESLGATYVGAKLDGQHCGVPSGLGAFSFNGNKIITTGSGGMLVTNNEKFARRARHLTTQAKLDGAEYLHDEIGYNYRMSNVTAAMGLAQIRKLDEFLERKRAIASGYKAILDHELIDLPPRASYANPSYWLYTVQVDEADRDQLISDLREQGIVSRAVWPPLRRQVPYESCETLGGGMADRIWRTAVSLPSTVTLTDEEIGRVAGAVNTSLRAQSAERATTSTG